jgi:hypothetical protein
MAMLDLTEVLLAAAHCIVSNNCSSTKSPKHFLIITRQRRWSKNNLQTIVASNGQANLNFKLNMASSKILIPSAASQTIEETFDDEILVTNRLDAVALS